MVIQQPAIYVLKLWLATQHLTSIIVVIPKKDHSNAPSVIVDFQQKYVTLNIISYLCYKYLTHF